MIVLLTIWQAKPIMLYFQLATSQIGAKPMLEKRPFSRECRKKIKRVIK